MIMASEPVLLDSLSPHAGEHVAGGGALREAPRPTARRRGPAPRPRDAGCPPRLMADPVQFLAGHSSSCCAGRRAPVRASGWT